MANEASEGEHLVALSTLPGTPGPAASRPAAALIIRRRSLCGLPRCLCAAALSVRRLLRRLLLRGPRRCLPAVFRNTTVTQGVRGRAAASLRRRGLLDVTDICVSVVTGRGTLGADALQHDARRRELLGWNTMGRDCQGMTLWR
ncbi:hypothetical protein ONE63_003332 [Megalurothrips usitatus]|uniref:Uncharacterized protein n=1 Tax=Megalurothrips usitatus TaxID=439358 RepID=A0AAV7XAP0_9NEOP|nr:hypothetical protein ONE63_003332 [Megalurothrips usitatus]